MPCRISNTDNAGGGEFGRVENLARNSRFLSFKVIKDATTIRLDSYTLGSLSKTSTLVGGISTVIGQDLRFLRALCAAISSAAFAILRTSVVLKTYSPSNKIHLPLLLS
jgi:hypothetical protein